MTVFIKAVRTSGNRVLDVGSADGPSIDWLKRWGTVFSLDLDPRGLTAPRAVCGSVLSLPFSDSSFDVVAAFDVLEHCAPEDHALAELTRVLVPGGKLLLSVPAYRWAWSDHDLVNGHHRRYTLRRTIEVVEAAGLTVERATYAFAAVFPFFVAERLARRLAARLGGGAPKSVDVVKVPAITRPGERLLLGLSRIDERLLSSRDLPFGSSVLAAAVKPDAT